MNLKDAKRIAELRDDPVLHAAFMDGVSLIISMISGYLKIHKTMNHDEFQDLILNPLGSDEILGGKNENESIRMHWSILDFFELFSVLLTI